MLLNVPAEQVAQTRSARSDPAAATTQAEAGFWSSFHVLPPHARLGCVPPAQYSPAAHAAQTASLALVAATV